ncbi:MAG: DUF4936 family protein [Undibacterium sp.]|nr:DUF4936 family protein [Undibacterium sp.]
MDCYVYYKTAEEHETLLLEQVKRIREMLAMEINVILILQRRTETNEGIITWMEIYRQIPNAFTVSLAAIVNKTEIMSLIIGERHTEYFTDTISCA